MSKKKLVDLIQQILKNPDSHKDIPQAKPLSHQALEARLLLDAAGLATWSDATDESQEAGISVAYESELNDATASLPIEAKQESVQLYVVNDSVPDIGTLLNNIDADGYIHILNSKQSGPEQLSNILNQYSSVSAVHILSHGTSGELGLGNTVLTSGRWH